MTRSVALATTLLLLGCQVGTRLEDFGPALGPHGARAHLKLAERVIQGELLAVEHNSLLVLNDNSLVSVRFSAIRKGSFHQVSVTLRDGRKPTEEERRTLKLVSRFPQDVSPELLQALLEAYRQEAPQVIRK